VENEPIKLVLTNDEAAYLWDLLANLRAKPFQPSEAHDHQVIVAIHRKLGKAAKKPES
jgi:hypothetical protein